jgi:predicted CopG family antitoxin
LLKDNNYQYLKNTVAFTQSEPEHVYWDDYYNKLTSRKNSKKSFSTFSEIMKHPPLKAAFWLSLLLLLLYILFGGKRVQRIIQQLKPNENTTVTFTETIGRLYLQKKDNKNIADKMITYFNEYIRNTYFLNTNHVNDDFIVMLSRKSGVDRDKVDTIYRTITTAQASNVVNDYQLLSLQEQIQQFYKNTGKKY